MLCYKFDFFFGKIIVQENLITVESSYSEFKTIIMIVSKLNLLKAKWQEDTDIQSIKTVHYMKTLQ